MAYRFTHFLDIMLIFSDIKVSITILHFAICTYRNLVSLACFRTEDVLKKKTVSVKSIHDLGDSFSE